ncbi:MAG: adenylyltransferase/cytidyltransferase family protein [bacterium]|nr:adenylyltransferase/cytidyltransferase family protein [bacterium]
MKKKPVLVLVTGVFDALHEEHEVFLRKAKEQGDVLFIGVESDVRVRQMKGESRPLNSQAQRVVALESLGVADRVFVLPEKFSKPEEHRALLREIRPDILAVSSHSPHLAEKQQLLQEIGGRVVVVHQHNPSISTTLLVQKKQQEQHGSS